MFSRILVPVDGSSFSEEVLSYAVGIAHTTAARLTLLRVADGEADLTAATDYVQALARQVGADGEVVVKRADIARTILDEAEREPLALIAMTSHGRTGLREAVLGSVALSVMRDATSPVLIYRPRGEIRQGPSTETHIGTVFLPLDGSEFSESMESEAVQMAKWLKANLVLLQVITPEARSARGMPPGDIVESSYLRVRANTIARSYGVEADWDVLGGEAADAICKFLNGRRDAMLAMSSHARSGLRQTIFGSVTAECLRSSGVPILVRHPGI